MNHIRLVPRSQQPEPKLQQPDLSIIRLSGAASNMLQELILFLQDHDGVVDKESLETLIYFRDVLDERVEDYEGD